MCHSVSFHSLTPGIQAFHGLSWHCLTLWCTWPVLPGTCYLSGFHTVRWVTIVSISCIIPVPPQPLEDGKQWYQRMNLPRNMHVCVCVIKRVHVCVCICLCFFAYGAKHCASLRRSRSRFPCRTFPRCCPRGRLSGRRTSFRGPAWMEWCWNTPIHTLSVRRSQQELLKCSWHEQS